METLVAVVAISLASGTLIGVVGLGGVLLVPLMTGVLDLPLRDSVVAASFGFLASGLAAATTHAIRDGMSWRQNLPLWGSAAFGATMGAALLIRAAPVAISGFIGALAVASGLITLKRPTHGCSGSGSGWRVMSLLGAATGLGSSLSGTGGAVVLLPLLVIRGTAVKSAIIFSQSIQIPITLSATAYYLSQNLLNVHLSVATAVGLVPGTLLGVRLARRFAPDPLRRVVAGLLIATGLWYLNVLR